MAVKIRMTRIGRRHRPFFRINAIDSRAPRDGKILEKLGHYDPLEKDKDKQVVLNLERVKFWLDNGAIPSDTISEMLAKVGIKTKHAQEKATRREKAKAIARVKGKPFNQTEVIAAQKAVEKEAAAKAAEEEKAKADAEKAKAKAEAKEKAKAEEAPAEEPAAEETKAEEVTEAKEEAAAEEEKPKVEEKTEEVAQAPAEEKKTEELIEEAEAPAEEEKPKAEEPAEETKESQEPPADEAETEKSDES